MANWANPTLTSTYTNFVNEVKDRDVDVAVWFEGITPTNTPTNAKRLNVSTGRFEKWNGSAWVDAVATFTFPALSVAGAATVTGALTINGGIANNPTLTAGTANGVAYLNGSKVLTTGSALTFDGSRVALATATSGIQLTTTVNTNQAFISLADADGRTAVFRGPNSGAPNCAQIGTTSNHDTAFLFGGSEQMRLTSTGLGIGTSSPTQRLEVNGNIRVNNGSTFFSQGDLFIRGGSNGSLRLGANDANDLMILNPSGNLGLGVTPSAWGSLARALEIGSGASTSLSFNFSETNLGTNVYRINTGASLYKANGIAMMYTQSSGGHSWLTAPSGTAGNAISFTQAMTLDANGNLAIGATSAGGRLTVLQSGAQLDVGTNSTRVYLEAIDRANVNNSVNIEYYARNAAHVWYTGAYTERARITADGALEADFSVASHWRVPRGSTVQRTTSPGAGMIRFNTTLSRYEGHNGSAWSSIGGGATGGGSDDVFYENGQTVTTNYTITTNKNAMSAGPVTIASGITVTVPSGSNWVVV